MNDIHIKKKSRFHMRLLLNNYIALSVPFQLELKFHRQTTPEIDCFAVDSFNMNSIEYPAICGSKFPACLKDSFWLTRERFLHAINRSDKCGLRL